MEFSIEKCQKCLCVLEMFVRKAIGRKNRDITEVLMYDSGAITASDLKYSKYATKMVKLTNCRARRLQKSFGRILYIYDAFRYIHRPCYY